ncbi:hypothetical protein PENSPDRAFT_730999 [Peniophora sp. CONT]|nr:hypothetical protein PENSPDRAFT_730999 [Peniophora sp. CONT]
MSASASPPSLMYSSSSGPTSSPPQTPPRRARTMYPAALGKGGEVGRVPLHRRGTSRTYERLEDLLKEAGYKETRVITPQKPGAGMDDGDEEEEDGKEKRGGVMRFLSGLVAGRSTVGEEGRRKREERESWSVPASPSARIRRFPDEGMQGMSDGESYSPRGRTRTSTSQVQPQAGPSRAQTQPLLQTHYQHPLHASPRSAHPDLQPLTRTTSTRNTRVSHLLPPERMSASQHPTYAQASPARAMLRHMASAPTMARTRSDRGARRPPPLSRNVDTVDLSDAPSPSSSYQAPPQHRRKKSAPDPTEPPLPATWLESVARALLGVPGAHVGRPQSPALGSSDVEDGDRRLGSNISASASEITIRPAKSGSGSLSRAGSTLLRQGSSVGMARQNSTISSLVRTDSTSSSAQERGRPRARPPAALLLGASHAAVAEASRTRVVCRSAPASRATSRVREEPGSIRGLRKVAPAQKKTKVQSPLPSPPAVSYPLPRARGSGAAMGSKERTSRRRAPTRRKSEGKGRNRDREGGGTGISLSLHGQAEGEAFEWSSGASSSSESEGTGREVDLGMLLRAGSPRRQASVQSLRRHLSMSSRGVEGESGGDGAGRGKRRRGIPREWADGE